MLTRLTEKSGTVLMDETTSKGLHKVKKNAYKNLPYLSTQIQANCVFSVFTDGSKYCWGASLCQYTSKIHIPDDLKPIIFKSGNFQMHNTIIQHFLEKSLQFICQLKDSVSIYKMPNVQYYVIINH